MTKREYFTYKFIFTLLALLQIFGTHAFSIPRVYSQDNATPLISNTWMQKAVNAAVRIDFQDSPLNCSGFIVSPQGHVLTALHCLGDLRGVSENRIDVSVNPFSGLGMLERLAMGTSLSIPAHLLNLNLGRVANLRMRLPISLPQVNIVDKNNTHLGTASLEGIGTGYWIEDIDFERFLSTSSRSNFPGPRESPEILLQTMHRALQGSQDIAVLKITPNEDNGDQRFPCVRLANENENISGTLTALSFPRWHTAENREREQSPARLSVRRGRLLQGGIPLITSFANRMFLGGNARIATTIVSAGGASGGLVINSNGLAIGLQVHYLDFINFNRRTPPVTLAQDLRRIRGWIPQPILNEMSTCSE